ncbi:MAG: twitch domain-containing radical SAM protein [Bdellovibrionales bacterium]|nr:twitch domain-containing radical SAM protein [Bdellovibrionales bacterium]NQZ20329.1 twitch domain-containing radical SAM protein [Bdellovibrionales bacterium]
MSQSLDKKELLKESKVFCMAPWTHLHTWPSGEVYPCCMTPFTEPAGHLSKNSLKEIWNSPNMRQLRKNMLSGKKTEACDRCYKTEEAGVSTLRNSLNYDFSKHFPMVEETAEDGSVETFNLIYFDFRFSNLCNFKCRSCGPQLSSSWFEDDEALFGPSGRTKVITPNEDPEDFWKQVEPHLPFVEEIYFAGGEPLIMEEHYRILKYLVEHEMFHIRLKYNTNFSLFKYKGHDAMELWDKFDSVLVGASLDAEGERGEYMRKGQRWNNVLKNRKRMMEVCPRVEFFISPTVSLFNALHLPDFHKSWVELGFIDIDAININYLFEPTFYRIQALPESLKDQVRKKYNKHIEEFIKSPRFKAERSIDYFKAVLTFMDSEDRSHELDGFYNRNDKLDKIRDEDFYKIFPEYEVLRV